MGALSLLLLAAAQATPAPAAPAPAPVPPAHVAPVDGLPLLPDHPIVFQLESAGDHLRPVGVHPFTGGKLAPNEVKAELKAAPPGTPGVDPGKTGMMLVVTNNRPSFLHYRAAMKRPGAEPAPTSVCTVMSKGRIGFESWPYPIEALALYDFRAVADKDMRCE